MSDGIEEASVDEKFAEAAFRTQAEAAKLTTELASLRQQLAEALAGHDSILAHNKTLVCEHKAMGGEVVRLSNELAEAKAEIERVKAAATQVHDAIDTRRGAPSWNRNTATAMKSILRAAMDYSIAQFECKARKSNCDPPQECDWPFCGCDPGANRFMEAIEESGCEIVQSATIAELREKLAAAETADGWLSMAPAEIKNAFASIMVLNFFVAESNRTFQMAGAYDGAMDEECKSSFMQNHGTHKRIIAAIKRWNSESPTRVLPQPGEQTNAKGE